MEQFEESNKIYKACKKQKCTVNAKLVGKIEPSFLTALNKPAKSVETAAPKFCAFLHIELAVEKLLSDVPITEKAVLEKSKCVDITVDHRENCPHDSCSFEADIRINKNCDMEHLNGGVSVTLIFSKYDKFHGRLKKINPKGLITILFRPNNTKGVEGQSYDKLKEFHRRIATLYWHPNYNYYAAQLDAIRVVSSSLNIQKKLAFTVSNNSMESPKPFHRKFVDSNLSPKGSPKPVLNAEQARAIREISYDTTSTFLLFGPPGTGKTSTLVEAVINLVENGANILICTPSNKAADVFVHALVKRGFNDTQLLYRFMSRSRDIDELDNTVYSYCRIFTDNMGNKYYGDIEPKLFTFSVVVCTLGSTPKLVKSVDPEHIFSHIIVDEAGQAPEMNVWMALANFDSYTTRLILAGDPKQLGPVTTVRMLETPLFGYKLSMLARLNSSPKFSNNPSNITVLTKNYRSHESIVTIFSNLFYDGILEHMEPKGHDSLCNWNGLRTINFPVMFHNVNGTVSKNKNKSSSNQKEADVVVDYIQSLRKINIKDGDIGVVSPYKSQAALVRKCLNLRKGSKLTVESVEKFQGSERRIILLTAVRNGSELGFLSDPKRLNTALSRAQHLLIVIGHAKSLSKLSDWKEFIDYCKLNDSFV